MDWAAAGRPPLVWLPSSTWTNPISNAFDFYEKPGVSVTFFYQAMTSQSADKETTARFQTTVDRQGRSPARSCVAGRSATCPGVTHHTARRCRQRPSPSHRLKLPRRRCMNVRAPDSNLVLNPGTPPLTDFLPENDRATDGPQDARRMGSTRF
jgi:hypothetical protein